MKLHKYSEKQLIEAVKNSTSMRQVLQKLGVAPYGGNYDVLKKAIKFYRLKTSHFSGQAWNKGKNLRLLCPNCHALTPTYRSKNRFRA
jgi:hypothetical protein